MISDGAADHQAYIIYFVTRDHLHAINIDSITTYIIVPVNNVYTGTVCFYFSYTRPYHMQACSPSSQSQPVRGQPGDKARYTYFSIIFGSSKAGLLPSVFIIEGLRPRSKVV